MGVNTLDERFGTRVKVTKSIVLEVGIEKWGVTKFVAMITVDAFEIVGGGCAVVDICWRRVWWMGGCVLLIKSLSDGRA